MPLQPLYEKIKNRATLLILSIPFLLIVLIFVYLDPYPVAFPMDDTYIHFVYAENLAEGSGLYFSFPDEVGVGTTSFLWVAMLAAGARAGFSIGVLAKVMGALSLLITALCSFTLLKRILKPGLAWLGALLIVGSGNLLWFSLSGMETMLFVAIGFIALICYGQKRWKLLGLFLGLLALTRPEGIMLSGAVVLVEIIRSRKISSQVLIVIGLCLVVAAPWYLYIFSRTGHFLPTSAVGKQLTHRVGMQYVLDSRPGLAWLGKIPALIYLGSWVVYILEFVVGGLALPAPYLPIATLGEDLTYSFSIWALFSWGLVIGLLWRGFRKLIQPQKWRSWIQDPEVQPWLVFLLWVVLHNLALMIWMPVPGTASRYGAINHVLLWCGLVYGLATLVAHQRRFLFLLVGLLMIAGVNTRYWDRVYQANLEHMREVRVKAAHYIRDEIAPGDLCAASDVGAIRYFSERPIIDMGALVNPDAGRWFSDRKISEYLILQGARCLVVPGRMNTQGEGWFDLLAIMGLSGDSQIQLDQLALFEIDKDRWLLGYLPTSNYQASVVVYRLEY